MKRSKEKLRNAAKARISRMVKEKSKRTDLQAPSWLKEEWAKGTQSKDQLAHILESCNFEKAGMWIPRFL